ncbi:hypothetical protein FOC1_g10010393 [Fusarium oxysporum f. sp. cubense race 1]|uniref:F-box domain-containing protein n=1 Tax=Fusarium oxysporum f. sp. cubense (strain race 1) TaxID=1229664 RepID=N4UXX6_FUSC1|nr:hypothetical protein FOC1_g10010393 [Fusarium oxysporum f. sp. cubense race 1]
MSTNSRSLSLLELPVDVTLCILDHAELHVLFFLSQTCKTMQRLAKRDFHTMANTNVEGKVDFLLGLAYVLPDLYFCRQCCKLHTVNRPPTSVIPLLCRDNSINHRCSWISYDVQHQHVQLALKYNRLGELYRDALAPIMQPYYKSCFGSYWGSYVSFSATPEIQSGRFLLHEKWHLNANLDPSPWRSNVYIPICNHLDFMGRKPLARPIGRLQGASWSLIRHVTGFEDLKQEPRRSPRGSCKVCLTSYDCSVSKANGVIINATHDYGSFSSLDEWKRRRRIRHGVWISSTTDFVFIENVSGEFDAH